MSNDRPRSLPAAAAVLTAAVVGMSACGGDEANSGVQRVTLSATATSTQGYDLARRRVVAYTGDADSADFYLSLTMIVSLFAPDPDAGFCDKGQDFARVADVPSDAAGCGWYLLDLGGNAPHADSWFAGQGFLVKDRAGVVAGKVLIVSDSVYEQGGGRVVFDFAPLSN